MIEAAVKNTTEEYVKYKQFDAMKRDFMKTYAGTLLTLLAAAVFTVSQQFLYAAIAAIVAVVYPFIINLLAVKGAKYLIKKTPGYLDMMAFYTFHADRMTVSFDFSGKNTVIRYGELFCVYETEDCFYLYLNTKKTFIVPKNKLTAGTPEQLSKLLKTALLPRRKYIFRR